MFGMLQFLSKMTAAGLYIHIPFCRSRCSYCDFATGIYQSELAESYVASITREITVLPEVKEPGTVDTVYFGGGTPSTLFPHQLDRILTAVRSRFRVSGNAEVTMEMNPGTVSRDVLNEFKSLGINRASFGAQTFDDRELARLGRSHTTAQTRQTFSDLRDAGFTNISFDLIAGLPGQTMAGWLANVRESLALRPEHLSFYLLEVHEGTPLADHIKQGRQPAPDEDLAAAMYEQMISESHNAGYVHYEISNLSLPGFESRHNTKYWTGLPYYGFGCSAHSYDGKLQRWANERDVLGYMKLVDGDVSPVVQRVELNEHDRQSENLFLGMRLMKGISIRHHQEMFGVDLLSEHPAEIERFAQLGLIEVGADSIRLTRAGALLSNEVFAAFV